MHILPYLSDLKFDSSIQVIVKHSQDKDQFLKESIKRMQETQLFEDELKESTELNSFLYARNQEHEDKLSEESKPKDGKFWLPFLIENQVISEYTLDWSWHCLAEYKNWLVALGVTPGTQDSETKAFIALRADYMRKRLPVAQVEANILSWAVPDLKISADRFATQIPILEDKVKRLENKVVDGLNEIRALELCLERTTWANHVYQKQVTQLSKRLESMFLNRISSIQLSLTHFFYWPHFDLQNQMPTSMP
jgi:hypothetical protein